MCEIFGICGRKPIKANGLLTEFYSHSNKHYSGWGLAVYRNQSVSLEKEPEKALNSTYLRHRLTRDVVGKDILAHIRYATIGDLNYSNCHPFVWDDDTGRTWTLIHNGTIFHTEKIRPFFQLQEGTTDSEGILLYFIDEVNRATRKLGRPLNPEERFQLIDKLVIDLSFDNKLNFLLFDGEQMYVHCNVEDTLYVWEHDQTAIFCTQPLKQGSFKNVPICKLLGYRDGQNVFTGTFHGHEHFEDEYEMRLLYGTYANL